MFHCHRIDSPGTSPQPGHADFLHNQELYLRMRPHLLRKYHDQWIAFQDGCVIASGLDLESVAEAVSTLDVQPYIVRVGAETRRLSEPNFPFSQPGPHVRSPACS